MAQMEQGVFDRALEYVEARTGERERAVAEKEKNLKEIEELLAYAFAAVNDAGFPLLSEMLIAKAAHLGFKTKSKA